MSTIMEHSEKETESLVQIQKRRTRTRTELKLEPFGNEDQAKIGTMGKEHKISKVSAGYETSSIVLDELSKQRKQDEGSRKIENRLNKSSILILFSLLLFTPHMKSNAQEDTVSSLAKPAEDLSRLSSAKPVATQRASLDPREETESPSSPNLARSTTSLDGELAVAETSDQLTAEEERADFNLLTQTFDYHSSMPVITKRELANAIREATANVERMRDLFETTQDDLEGGVGGSDGWLASSFLHKSLPLDAHLSNQTNQALVSEETTRILARRFGLSRIQILRGLPLISVDQTNLGRYCARQSRLFNCIPGRFRSFSGHCNNVQNPDWGAAQTPLVRYAPAKYADQVSRPLNSSPNKLREPNLLPSSRAVSVAIFRAWDGSTRSEPPNGQHSHITTMMSFFGQFVLHDIAHIGQYNNGASSIKCCEKSTEGNLHPECMPIEHKGFCLEYVRSTPAIRSGCNLGPRDQLNMVSSFLDGSVIYGSSEEQNHRLRTFSGGRLRSQRVSISAGSLANGQQQTVELLPSIKTQPNGNSSLDAMWRSVADECSLMSRMKRKRRSDSESAGCFQAGDSRVNQNIGLSLMHTIWLREHNHIADKLAQLNKHWTDERIFEEARRIVGAELQHITFSEFLPSVVGEEVMSKLNLSTLSEGYSQSYDPQLNGGLSNELATAVLPFILSTIPSSLERYSDRLEMVGQTSLADTFMDGSDLFKGNVLGQYLMGMMSQNAMEPISGLMHMTKEVERLVSGVRLSRQAGQAGNKSLGEPPKIDLVAMIIQQGRDHGLKSYTFWREACQLKPIVRSFEDLRQLMPPTVVEKLRSVYANVHQIDLYAAILEEPVSGATLGPTFVCLLGRQFFHLKNADRFWFENDLPETAFTSQQLEEIRQSSLAKVLCRNSQWSLSFVQPAPMITSDPYLNAYQYCNNKAVESALDLSKWRQVVSSAQQPIEHPLSESGLARAKRTISENTNMIVQSIVRAHDKLNDIAHEEVAKLRRLRRSTTGRMSHYGAGYRYLPRAKRQTLKINNQSLIFELATNDLVRSMLHQGKDREQANSIESDIKDFMLGLESAQLDNLVDNSANLEGLSKLISSAGEAFLTLEQRSGLALLGDRSLDPVNESVTPNSLSRGTGTPPSNCQDDERAFPCDHTSPFRTITGWCNNLQHPKFGRSFTIHDRILPSSYDDGLSRPRQSSVLASPQGTGKQRLPSARLVSTTMHDNQTNLHPRYSLALMQFGQFGVDHDLTKTPFSVSLDGSLLDCSDCDSQRTVHRDCLPIEVPPNDVHFRSPRARELTGASSEKCLHFVRSLNGQTGLGPRQQLNALTSYIDASNVYGSDNCEAKSLRTFIGGRLNSSVYPARPDFPQFPAPREILPVTRANPECVTPSGICFHAGDQRASEQPGLTSIHTVFMRLHNSIVRQLALVNKHWNDEKLYQHGRKIVGAIMQRITYNEFAPRLLGLDYMSRFDLILKQVGYANENYDDSCSASILNEFASAAFRMGHSLIRSAFPLLNKQFKQIGKSFQLREAFFNSQRILTEPNLIDSILRGIVSSPIETLDNSVTEELTNHLFEKPKEPFSGMDLISLNIQRARDHGIPGYNNYRAKCNLTRVKNFQELNSEIPAKLIKRLSKLYSSPDDIDLFTGGMSELPVHGGIIGPTLGCIIGMQFSRLKRCDRFWHETSDPWVRFTLPQLAEIRKMSLAKVICQESDNIDTIQRNAMDVNDQYLVDFDSNKQLNRNPRVPCSSLPSMDLRAWRENNNSCHLDNKFKLGLGQSKRIGPCRSCTCTLEGPICRTAKIDCMKVLRAHRTSRLKDIMADKSCLVQCSWVLDMPMGEGP